MIMNNNMNNSNNHGLDNMKINTMKPTTAKNPNTNNRNNAKPIATIIFNLITPLYFFHISFLNIFALFRGVYTFVLVNYYPLNQHI